MINEPLLFRRLMVFLLGCTLSSERRLECRNLFNFYLSSYSLCANDYQVFPREKIDELVLANDYNCLDHSYQCYFEFDSTWSACFTSLRKLTVENLSFVVRLYNSRRLLPLDYLKIVNTHGSITELLHLFQFSNRSSIYIENFYPRWSGMDLYSLYLQYSSIVFKQFWVNVYDWYPIAYMRYDQQLNIRQWLSQIPCKSGTSIPHMSKSILKRRLFVKSQKCLCDTNWKRTRKSIISPTRNFSCVCTLSKETLLRAEIHFGLFSDSRDAIRLFSLTKILLKIQRQARNSIPMRLYAS